MSGEFVGDAVFGEPHCRATGVGAEQNVVVPLTQVFGERERHFTERLDCWLRVGCDKRAG